MGLSIQNLTKNYGNVRALSDCSLEIGTGELVCLVGPSGCGKSTLLNIVAGFLNPESGDVVLNERSIVGLPVRERNVAFIMEGLGLYPHLSVFENIAYPLRVRRVAESEVSRRVTAVCQMTGLIDLQQRQPGELSGGQRQRTAVARALVRDDARILLADECFSGLDAQLKYQLRGEFRTWQRFHGLTCLFVTHDQEEAMALGDRIALMTTGRIDQVGPPGTLYSQPRSLFAATFLGRPAANLVPLRRPDGDPTAFGRWFLSRHDIGTLFTQTPELQLAFRPEDVEVVQNASVGLQATVEWAEPISPDTVLHLRIDGLKIAARIRALQVFDPGTSVTINIQDSNWYVFDPTTGARVWPKEGVLHA